MKILFFGDIFGQPGREAVKRSIVQLKEQYQPDFIIGNVENVAHGSGVTKKTLGELEELGLFHAYTSGNHIWDAPEVKDIMSDGTISLLRPLNYPGSYPGRGDIVISNGAQRLLVINVLGTVFMKDVIWEEALTSVDKVLENYTIDAEEEEKEFVHGIFIDFHGETTAEKRSFGLYFDGRVSGVVGTHTHVPTRDEQILPKSTAYISDVGMVGPMNSSIGLDPQFTIAQFLTGETQRKEVSDDPVVELGAVVIDIGKNGLATSIEAIRKMVSIA